MYLNWEHKNLPNRNYRPIATSEYKDMYMLVTYPFLDHFQLVAYIEKPTGHQGIAIEYLAEDGKVLNGFTLSCTHTAITTTTLEEIQSIPSNTSKEEYFYGVQSTEVIVRVKKSKKKQVNVDLSLEEHFFALQSWVQGIAEAGMEIFKNIQMLQEFTDELNIYPMIRGILCFIFQYNREYLETYLRWVEKECQIDGKPHIPSLIASLEPLTDFTNISHFMLNEEYPELDDILLSMDFPIEVYAATLSYKSFKRKFDTHPDYKRVIFKYPNKDLAADQSATQFEGFKTLFSCKISTVIQSLVNNESAVRFPEYRELYSSLDSHIRSALASSRVAMYWDEFKDLFYDRDPVVRFLLARNKSAVAYSEFKLLLKDKRKDIRETAYSQLIK